MSGGMVAVALILFVLTRYHSPQLAGLTAFLAFFPGAVVAPVAGAILDRYGRVKFIVLDDLVAAASGWSVALLSTFHALPPILLLAIVTVSSLTLPLSASGSRSLFPILVPPHLWERANALDSVGHVVSQLVGAPLAGIAVATFGPEAAIAIAGTMVGAAGVIIIGVHDPSVRTAAEDSLLVNAWRGLAYTVRSASLRGIALTLSTFNLAFGVLTIAIPVLLLYRLHQGPATVGITWGVLGAGGLVSALVIGRVRTQGIETKLMSGAITVSVIAVATLPFANSALYVMAAALVIGMASGPLDISVFTLRQRRTNPAWFGRVFAVSMTINALGAPFGSALAGPLVAWSLNSALWFATAVAAVAAVIPQIAIPAKEPLVDRQADDRQ